MTAPRPTAAVPDSLLEIDGLATSFQTPRGALRAVDGVSLRVERGQTVCIAGESGCGKSVTALSVMGLLPQAARVEGAIRFNGVDLLTLPPAQRRALRGRAMAMVFQEPMSALNPVQSIGWQVAEVFAIHGTAGRAEARQKVLALLRRVGIADPERRYDEYPHQMSGGMKQRVMIAMALANGPELLIADEPTTALDVTIQAQVLQLLREAQRELGTGILFVTHDLAVVAGIADRLVVMVAGRVVEQGSVIDVLETPAHPYTIALLAARPRPGLTRRGGDPLPAIPGAVPSPFDRVDGCRYQARCPRVQARCRTDAPALARVTRGAGDGHAAACHFPEGGLA
ncbi:ABC transporter ATP-binding protein [Scleromatobacter humisilvae]|uniref:ABC transporter ATP-binding protein n=1 Tax=Scleromatobacter humisilvae TaxID=2897159 RepID=A0A9X1YR77_9BURK|nr:ABC transporter ATP-binding protein [Scleromatobacter humisilvae]MCK9686961.1 ABC transporter ATP-binding protein [Scleromatobacter humisilvae]